MHEWKRKSEESAKREQGKKLPGEYDAVNTLVAAATGQTEVFLPNLMPNASKAASGYFERLDPRFIVETSYYKGSTHYSIHPKEPVDFKLSVDSHYKKQFLEKFKKSIEHGDDVVIESSAVKFKGLPILEEIQKDKVGSFQFEKLPRKPITIRIKLVSPDSKKEVFFYDFAGYYVIGTKSITLRAAGLDGLISLKATFFTDADLLLKDDAIFNFTNNFNLWDRSELNTLQYFDKIYDFFYKMKSGWEPNFYAETKGCHLFSARCNMKETFLGYFIHLNFIRMVRDISNQMGSPLYYDSSFELTEEIYSKVEEVYEVVTKGAYSTPFKGNLQTKCEIDDFLAEALIRRKEGKECFLAIRQEQVEPEQIILFHQEVTLPKLAYTITIVEPEIVNKDYKNIHVGELVEIELIPTDNCKYIVEELSATRSN
ncbi:MAG: hypothetical protein D3914_10720 [Candidatus Electrothrix sp. LOE2]|nr:hypothetical protein [Candidatus Electrothrix sp. LOE2]